MRALITGGAGFIGSHLSEALLAAGREVFVIDNLSTGSIDNIAHLRSHQRFHYTIDTVTNVPVLAELVDQCDVVFHLAAAVGVKLIVEQPVHTIETNVHGTEVVLQQADKKKKLVVIASTSEVYGKSADVPFREDADLVLGPTRKQRWAYACSKAIDEFLALAYCREKRAARHHRPAVQHRRARGRPAATAWSCRASSARPSRGGPSPSTATAPRRAASPTSATSCGRSWLLPTSPGPWARSSTSGTAMRSRFARSPSGSRR